VKTLGLNNKSFVLLKQVYVPLLCAPYALQFPVFLHAPSGGSSVRDDEAAANVLLLLKRLTLSSERLGHKGDICGN
jgi:hypothetical protein